MTQEEVLDFLEENKGEWFTASQINPDKSRCTATNLATIYKSITQRIMYGLQRREYKGHFAYEWRVIGGEDDK